MPMDEPDPPDERIFHALAEPARRAILVRLGGGEAHVGALVSHLNISQSAVSQQLRILRDAGLVQERREGRRHYFSIRPEALVVLWDWLSQFKSFMPSAPKVPRNRPRAKRRPE